MGGRDIMSLENKESKELLCIFRKISKLIIKNLRSTKEATMYNLAKKLINYKEEKNIAENNLYKAKIF